MVYVDGSGFAMDGPRDHGYGPKGQRCYAKKDWHARGRVNAIGAITDFKFFNACLFDTYINLDVFYAWPTQELLPNVPQNAVIVLDNATFHKRKGAQDAIEQKGCTLEFLPPYSPDLNPIEKKWAQAKSIRRKFGYTPDELFFCEKLF
ncbi:transposase [Muricauda sp. SCSIO 64092]|uniref:transposase n=1 Tax=Allomuricauda sp. SCSIO 64092 TaxID=2908842 RepID=UPI001FF21EE0|nr:transposase [Muricauda sp. SCSIO 64092]UOY08503.1 transposase [Muricauda sp. SCSIO 64092]